MSLSHLLILTPGFPIDEADTTCLPAVQQFLLCFMLQFPTTKISVITLHYPFTAYPYTWNGIDVYPINGQNKTGLYRIITVLKATKKAKSIHKQSPINAVLSFWLTDAALAGKYFSNSAKIPHLIWMHGQDARPGNKYVKIVDPSPRQLAAISAYQMAVFNKAYNRKASYIINNGINPDIFPALNSGKRKIDFLAAGNLIPLKQYHLFVELLYQLKKEGHNDIKAVLAGEGILLEEMEALRKKYSLEQQLEIIDKISHSTVLQMMNETRVFIHPSSYEGHSTVMLEALYSGCKVVSFLPVADEHIEHTIICSSFDEMKKTCLTLLHSKWIPRRILVNDMKNSVTKFHSILQSYL